MYSQVHISLGPRRAGTPMRAGRAHVDILVRGARTWLLQAHPPPGKRIPVR